MLKHSIYENRLKQMKLMEEKKITIADLKKAGFERMEELDFRDDGTKFQMLNYQGMPISYTKVDGRYYISIRPDYLPNTEYKVYSKLEAYKNVDEFNGVWYVSVGKLISNIKKLIEEMN